MKRILILLLYFFINSNLFASEIKLEKIIGGLDEPWGLSFVNDQKIIFTEKSGKLFFLNLKDKKKK